ncbi:MAG TPA: GDSL-type esterase/lipase family protein, partial [Steroidobacteraceae bacterium]|nr:GDSL-type esterase/lipase family protein [Steroidobacteraceae bacterium]
MLILRRSAVRYASEILIALSFATLTAGSAGDGSRPDSGTTSAGTSRSWVRSWGAAMMAPEEFDYYPDLGRSFDDVTLRQIVFPTLAGRSLRVLISNEYGTQALELGEAHVATVDHAATIVSASDRPLLFRGRPGTVLPAGATIFSDPVELPITPGIALAVSIYLPHSTAHSTSTVHEEGWRLGYVSGRGNHCADAAFPVATELGSYFYVAAVDVTAGAGAGAIVALGDSITDGTGSTPHAGRTWPDDLVQRLAMAMPMPGRLAVINMGIGGNRLLYRSIGPSALLRADRDALAVPGARYLLILEGINDIAGWPGHPE